jgi:hypothetical protein
MKKVVLFFSVLFISAAMLNAAPSTRYITENTCARAKAAVLKKGCTISEKLIDRGINQAASFWTSADGSHDEFVDFCAKNFCKNLEEKDQLFERLCTNFETILGHNNRVTIELLRPSHVRGFDYLPIDEIFGAYNGLAHFNEDMFNNKVAFIVIINFPHFTLREKVNNGENWTTRQWGYVRLGDVFTNRAPASAEQHINAATASAENYIANYNIYMGMVWSDKNIRYWSQDVKLITHWGLRDEIKAAYSDPVSGTDKQGIIYNILTRITNQTIPEDVINKDEYIWYPSSNQTYVQRVEIKGKSENNKRYEHLLRNFKAIKASDEYYEEDNFITRKFEGEYEISVEQAEQLFNDLLSSPQVKEVAELISKRLGRKLQPFDIWYDGFKARSTMDQQKLDELTRKKYPSTKAFANDLPNILIKLGFTKDKAQFICDHVTVDASVGAGHAWESMMKSDNSLLRTRIGDNGMDYKGYNIGIHEFGHNVEQTISLHNVDNYFLRGVPNTAFTEALAFTFQNRDLELLGLTNNDTINEDLNTLDIFWGCYEIMGVSLVDIKTWQWMYAHPKANAEQLKTAVLNIAKEVWNQYYAPIFKTNDQVILACYSHMICDPLYLSAYPIGHLIDFQLEKYLNGKNLGTEVQRIYSMGRLTPDLWMQRAVGEKLSTTPLLKATSKAVEDVANYDKRIKKEKKDVKPSKKKGTK